MSETAETFAQETTIHGIRQIFESRAPKWKIFWLLIVLAAFGAIIFEIYHVIIEFINFPPTTITSVVQHNFMQFPNIAICTTHRINASFAQKHKINSDLLEYIYGAFPERNLYDLKLNESRRLYMENQYQSALKRLSMDDIEDLLLAGGLDCSEVFTNANFDGQMIDNICEFVEPVITNYGKCFFLHLKDLSTSPEYSGLIQWYTGPSGGLTLLLNMYPKLHPKTIYNSYLTNAAFLFLGHGDLNGTMCPNDRNFASAPVGTAAYISLESRKRTVTLNCNVSASLAYFPGYVPDACIQECYINASLKYCSCIPVGMNELRTVAQSHRLCEPIHVMTCLKPMAMVNSSSNPKSIKFQSEISQCCAKCGQLCQSTSHQMSVMYAGFPNQGVTQRLKEMHRLDNKIELDKDFVMLQIYFTKISVTVTSENATFSVNSLISNIGGQLGLWAGCSVLSLVHVVAYIIQNYNPKCGRKRVAVFEQNTLEPNTQKAGV